MRTWRTFPFLQHQEGKRERGHAYDWSVWGFEGNFHCVDEGGEEIDGSLVSLLQRDEIVRKITQIFCLERLASGDTITARTLLANIVAVSTLVQKWLSDLYSSL